MNISVPQASHLNGPPGLKIIEYKLNNIKKILEDFQ